MRRSVCAFIFAVFIAALSSAAEVHVSPSGNDANPGTAANPLKTPAAARNAVRELRTGDGPTEPIDVIFAPGVYRLQETLSLGPEDGGTKQAPITYRAAPGGEVVISGGMVVDQWETTQVNGQTVWVAQLDGNRFPRGMRSLFVDGVRRPRAASDPIVPAGMWREEGKSIGLFFFPGTLPEFEHPEDAEVHQQVMWRHYVLPVLSAAVDELGRPALEIKDAQNAEWLSPNPVGMKAGVPVILRGAIELLDQPGEWYYDQRSGRLYYLPCPGERREQVEAVVPVVERLVEIVGGKDKPITDLSFEGITFAEADWTGPNADGWFGYDPGHIVRGVKYYNTFGFSFANVYLTGAGRIRFHRCTFTRMGGTGLHVHEVDDSRIVGNRFTDCGAEGLVLGQVRDPEHVPADLVVANNVLRRTGREYLMTAALLTGKLLRAKIHHNHVLDVPYIGMNVNKIFGKKPDEFGSIDVRFNRLENTMGTTHDGGAFYTWQDGSDDGSRNDFSENYIQGVYSHNSQGIYLDNDCRYWNCERNVVEGTLARWYLIKGSHHTLRDNFTDNPEHRRSNLHDPPNIDETGTTVAQDADWRNHEAAAGVVDAAGLEDDYRDLLDGLRSDQENSPPIVRAGEDRTVGLLDVANVSAIVQDDAAPYGFVHVRWSKVSGPGDVTFFGAQEQEIETHNAAGPQTIAVPVAFSAAGTYVLRFEADDMQAIGSDEVTFAVQAGEKGTNLTSGLPASAITASSSASEHTAPQRAFDGDPKTYWYPGYPGKGWVQADLGEPKTIHRVEMALRKDADHEHSRKLFEVLASNDADFSSYVTLGQQGYEPDPNLGGTWACNVDTGGKKYRYVRWWKRQPYDGVVNDLAVFGDE